MNIPTFLSAADTGMRHSRNSVNDIFGAWLSGNISCASFSYIASCSTPEVSHYLDFQFQNQCITLKYSNILPRITHLAKTGGELSILAH